MVILRIWLVISSIERSIAWWSVLCVFSIVYIRLYTLSSNPVSCSFTECDIYCSWGCMLYTTADERTSVSITVYATSSCVAYFSASLLATSFYSAVVIVTASPSLFEILEATLLFCFSIALRKWLISSRSSYNTARTFGVLYFDVICAASVDADDCVVAVVVIFYVATTLFI